MKFKIANRRWQICLALLGALAVLNAPKDLYPQVRTGRLPQTCPANTPLVRLNPSTQEWLCMALPPEMDNQILSSSVDANGNPNFLAAGAGLTLNLNGETTPLRLIVAGQYQTLTSNVSITLTATSNQFVYVTQDLTNPALVAADFGASALPPDYDYVAPAAPATDQHWFNLSDNQMYRYSGTAWVAVNRIFLGVARTSGAAIDGVVCEPYRLSPQKRFEMFGNASDGILEVTGATTVSGSKQYSFVRVDGATLTAGAVSGASGYQGMMVRSQNPILIVNAGIISAIGQGSGGGTATTGAGVVGYSGGWFGGWGGGGGGSSTSAGGQGGDIQRWGFPALSSGLAAAGGAINTAGGTGRVSIMPPFPFVWYLVGLSGSGGGSGAGDGVNKGGNGAEGAGAFWIAGPSIRINAGCSLTADGGAGAAGVAGNAGGGGGGGGGIISVAGGFISNAGTLSTSGGAGGAGVGTGGPGGHGGDGMALTMRLW